MKVSKSIDLLEPLLVNERGEKKKAVFWPRTRHGIQFYKQGVIKGKGLFLSLEEEKKRCLM